MDTNQIREIEDCAARAWPPEISEALDGWRLRYTQGVTRRGNSVSPNHLNSALPLAALLEKAEAFYGKQNAPTHFQICPAALPTGLDAALEQRGYTASAHTEVQIVPLAEALEKTTKQISFEIEIADGQSETWFATYRQSEGFDNHSAAVRQGIIQRITQPKALTIARLDGQPAAIGLSVYDSNWVGIFCMATLPDYRRRGAASAVLHAIAAWGQEQGAHNLYLQVMKNNPPA
ncbi:MAG: GNAT family N-acetyltransferase, partial [Anaerolineales bacterium]|nr:GNAT family N-acetyltransferase [Anaerolineales bacterium]